MTNRYTLTTYAHYIQEGNIIMCLYDHTGKTVIGGDTVLVSTSDLSTTQLAFLTAPKVMAVPMPQIPRMVASDTK